MPGTKTTLDDSATKDGTEPVLDATAPPFTTQQQLLDIATASAAAGSESTISHVSVKLPPFWHSNCEYWIRQCTVQFKMRKITNQETMFFHCVAVMDESTSIHCQDLILNPGLTPFDDLCKILKRVYGLQNFGRAEALFYFPPMEDESPSQMLAKMKSFLPDSHPIVDDCFFFRYLFLVRLPLDIRGHCEAQSSLSLYDLAQLADKLHASAASKQICAQIRPDIQPEVRGQHVSSEAPSGGLPDDYFSNVNAVSRRSPSDSRSSLCYYHERYKKDARKCRAPCTWKVYKPKVSGNGVTGRF